ncbi:MAG: AAA family ATPase [Chloroflexota bacterium]|nr:AAA family ATPase [Chloroflexota bacterium]MDE2949961.1 AAA family ATPase [Chloroflexota bacterium]
MQLKANPFRPDKPIDNFEQFAGRAHELTVLIRSMFNTGHGNARHMIVTGPRGIGKSSFINQIHSVTDNGDDVLKKLEIDAGDFRFRFPVFKCRARQGQSTEHIVSSLMDAMPTKLSAENVGNIVGDFVRKLKPSLSVAGISLEQRNESFTDLGREFVRTVSNLWLAIQHERDGIIFIIDEIDTVAETSGIASFLKVTTEELVDAGLDQIAFYLVGVTGAMQKLMSEHPSIGRVFENVELRPMSHSESRDVIERTLQSSSSSRNIRVSDESIRWVVETASGFPAIIHTLCYEAYENDTDQVLDQDDFAKAADEVVSRIKRAELGQLLRTAGAGDYRRILVAMAEYEDALVPRSYIGERIGRSSDQLGSYLDVLLKRNIIERTDRGVYRYVEPLLRLYVQKLPVLDPVLSSPDTEEQND